MLFNYMALRAMCKYSILLTQDHQKPHGAPSNIYEVPELDQTFITEEKCVVRETKNKASCHLFSWGKNLPVDRIVTLVDWFVFNLNAAEVYMHLQCDDVHLAWLEKDVKDLGFPSLYDIPPMMPMNNIGILYTLLCRMSPLINDVLWILLSTAYAKA